jgi:hypothetical protein
MKKFGVPLFGLEVVEAEGEDRCLPRSRWFGILFKYPTTNCPVCPVFFIEAKKDLE